MSGEQEHWCKKCGYDWEDFESVTDCPNCCGVRGTPNWKGANTKTREYALTYTGNIIQATELPEKWRESGWILSEGVVLVLEII